MFSLLFFAFDCLSASFYLFLSLFLRYSPHVLAMPVQLTVYGVEAVADRQNGEAIIGRNVLNQLVVTLNGIAGITEITD